MYEEIQAEATEKAKTVLSLPETEWKVKCDAEGCKVSVRKSDALDSNIVIVKTEINIPRKMDKVFNIYNDLSLWPNWNKDTTFRIVEKVSDNADVMNVSYKTPLVDNRDCVYYTAKIDGSPMHPTSTNSKSIVAQSIKHPLCPRKNGVVRAWVYLTTTLMTDDGKGGTDFVSVVHADPKGSIPSSIVNQTLGMANKQIIDFSAYVVKNIQ